MKKELILASASPRRKELLEVAGYEFKIISSNASELTDGIPAHELARLNALAKAEDIYSSNKNSVVIGADTVVCHNDEILGKPKDKEDAFRMLKSLSGSLHSVITGYAIVSENGIESGHCETFVKFCNLTDEEIRAYIETNEPMDKAGAYGIQEYASLFVEHINGDYFNVMGLPVQGLYHMLKKQHIFPKWQKHFL